MFDTETAILRELKLHIDMRIVSLGKERNSLVPINKLPVEVTASVLLDVISEYTRGELHPMHRLAQVQVYWKEVILNHPQFWAMLHWGDPMKLVAAKIRRSGNIPLTIVERDPYRKENKSPEKFMGLVTPHSKRWKTFKVGAFPLEHARRGLEGPLPLLEQLQLHGVVTPGQPNTLNLKGGPNLRHVDIRSIAIPFTPSILSNLLTLSISDISDRSLKDSFFEVLQASPNLQELKLASIRRSTNDPETNVAEATSEPIRLPKLRDIYIQEISPSISSRLLRLLRPSRQGSFRIFAVDDAADAIQTLRDLLTPQFPRPSIISCIISHPTWPVIHLAIDENYIEISGCSAPSFYPQIRLHVACWQHIYQQLHNTFPLTVSVTHDICLSYHGSLDEDQELHLFDVLPSVVRLYLMADISTALRMVQNLPEPVFLGQQFFLRWPGLQRIDLEVRLDTEAGSKYQHAFLKALARLIDRRRNSIGLFLVRSAFNSLFLSGD